MKRTLLEIYALLVCLITLTWALVTTGIGLYDVVRIASPDLTISSNDHQRFLTNDDYLKSLRSYSDKEPLPKYKEEELTKKRLEGAQIAIQEERRDGKKGLIQNLIAIVLNSLVFVAHWKVAKKARETV